MTDKPTEPVVVTFEGLEEASKRPDPVDLRGTTNNPRDRSSHRQYHWLYEDLLN